MLIPVVATSTCLFVPCFLLSLLWLGGSVGRVLGEDVAEPVQTVGSVPSLHGLLDVVPAETEARCGGCRQAELLVILDPAEALELGQPEPETGSLLRLVELLELLLAQSAGEVVQTLQVSLEFICSDRVPDPSDARNLLQDREPFPLPVLLLVLALRPDEHLEVRQAGVNVRREDPEPFVLGFLMEEGEGIVALHPDVDPIA